MFPRVLEFAACWGAAEKCTRCRLGQSCLPAAQRPFDRGQQRRAPVAAQQQRGAGNKEQTNKQREKAAQRPRRTTGALSGLGFGREAPQVCAHLLSFPQVNPKQENLKIPPKNHLMNQPEHHNPNSQLQTRIELGFSRG